MTGLLSSVLMAAALLGQTQAPEVPLPQISPMYHILQTQGTQKEVRGCKVYQQERFKPAEIQGKLKVSTSYHAMLRDCAPYMTAPNTMGPGDQFNFFSMQVMETLNDQGASINWKAQKIAIHDTRGAGEGVDPFVAFVDTSAMLEGGSMRPVFHWNDKFRNTYQGMINDYLKAIPKN